ncbi:hypothetical protein [Streptomyces uncialis]|uniref:TNF family profile domain-containing protein n=1 Tax=Streptomyces uncialis TaxID=1048205 RepID=A0A1Q4VCC9_9ACTN|nr:hypothetical protein [Streptomyces uncialis]OKH95409.1 hypothetical protein AB852_00625 [Streptomyces uncialis]
MLPPHWTWKSRDHITAVKLNSQVRDIHRWLENPPLFQCIRTKAVNVSGSTTLVPWNELSGNGFTPVTNSSGEITHVQPMHEGRYLVHVQMCGKQSGSPSHLYLTLHVNDEIAQVGVGTQESTGYMDSTRVTALLELRPTDRISTRVYISAGKTGYLTNTAEQQLASVFLGYWIGEI